MVNDHDPAARVSVKLMLGGVGVKGIDAKRSSKWVNSIFFCSKTFLKSEPVQFDTCVCLSVRLGLRSF